MNGLKSHIGFWMRMVSNHVSYSFARKLESYDVTVAEWVVLREMFDNKNVFAPSAVANLTGLTRGAVSKLLERLLNKGLITRTEAIKDRRFQVVQLTPAATKLIPKLTKLADQNDKEHFLILTPAERKTLMELLKKTAELHKLKKAPIE